ncbi:MAG: DUF1998 domain-containing protein [Verrucomicrobiota bacterium]|nr:DUF1998 domain-containing protein [Verrucomicrobiota bacterium]
MRYIPAARMYFISKRWRNSREQGYPLGLTSGLWKKRTRTTKPEKDQEKERIKNVMLFTTDIADALYLEPIAPLGLDYDGVITLQYALKQAIENVFQIESSEIGVKTMGGVDKKPNIFIYEAAEGSLGILSQFIDDPKRFNEVIKEAIKVCEFDKNKEIPASYDNLLSYCNQREHKIIDRFLIKDALEKLKICTIEKQFNKAYDNYDAQYKSILSAIDPNSSTEKKFIEYLYKNNLRLPDSAQKRVEGVYVQPDFFYEPDIHVFCDGTPHDKPDIIQDDKIKRQQLRSIGHKVFVYYYKDKLEKIIVERPDIFKKVR